ncbi:GH1 family beta-glucosidase [Flavihumibacter fluvii]|uniref:GH1 family beta-glucosidase n=1 Tax=Flavihumibacter fluvii TaxID=2838157 RepID=UPI001BDF103A|nr:GH1 family beta-glucosidase [Flavihumibacter fluvii]ULQ50937.1 GH1 family beta-glucosidase [Flavihumibacter fluvii]
MKKSTFSRRDFVKASSVTAAGASVATLLGFAAPNAAPAAGSPKPADLRFPDGFQWGVATAAYQIEGSPAADGKGKSIWDTYSHIPGKMRNNDTGDVAIDHYRRYKEDVTIIKDLGANAYRFSIAWTRIFPNGTGKPNPAGLDFYSRLVDELLAAGVTPYPTLYHWDLPQALQDKGGWQSRDTAKAFGDYAGFVAKGLGDRVKDYFTLNEFQNFVDMGHKGVSMTAQGKAVNIELAPGLKLKPGAINQVAHHAVLAHGLGVQAIRAMGTTGTRVGPAEVMFSAVPIIDTPDYVAAAEKATRSYNARFLDVMLSGQYHEDYLRTAGADAPKFTPEDLAIIASPVDFVGINIYIPKSYVIPSDTAPGYTEVPMNVSHPKMSSGWHTFSPEVMYWAPRLTNAIWKPRAIYITENGCAASDSVAPDGNVYDEDRVMYLRNVMQQLQRATTEGVPVKGNFVWSAMDNLEWTDGYGRRFGLVYVDFKTQQRIPKLSAKWFQEAAKRNAVV